MQLFNDRECSELICKKVLPVFLSYKSLCIVCCFWCKDPCQENGHLIVISCIQTWWHCALYSSRLKVLLAACPNKQYTVNESEVT